MIGTDNFESFKEAMDRWVFEIIHRDNAREVSSFRYLSYDWISPRGWYFWPKNKPGVYALKEIPTIDSCENECLLLSLYYYPSPDEPVFQHYSLAEQIVRVSPMFSTDGVRFQVSCLLHSQDEEDPDGDQGHVHMEDLKSGKGIPTIEGREKLNPALFIIAYLEVVLKEKMPVRISMLSPGRSRTMATKDFILTDEISGDSSTVICEHETDRDIPSWELGLDFIGSLANELSCSVNYDKGENLTEDQIYNAVITL